MGTPSANGKMHIIPERRDVEYLRQRAAGVGSPLELSERTLHLITRPPEASPSSSSAASHHPLAPELNPESEPNPPKHNLPHLTALSEFKLTRTSLGTVALSLRTAASPATPWYVCAGEGKGLELGLSFDGGMLAYSSWGDLLPADGDEGGEECKWVMATRKGNLTVSFFVGKILRAVAWAPFVGEAWGEGACS